MITLVSPTPSASQHRVFCHTSEKRHERQQKASSSPMHPPLFPKHSKYLLRPSKRDRSRHQSRAVCGGEGSPAAPASTQQLQDTAWAQVPWHLHPNAAPRQDVINLAGLAPGSLGSAGRPELQGSPQGSEAHGAAPGAGSPVLPYSFHRAVRAPSQSQSQSQPQFQCQQGDPGPHLTPTQSSHGATGIFGSDTLLAEAVLPCRRQ